MSGPSAAEPGFLAVLLASPTFWTGTVPWLAAAAGGILALALVPWRRLGRRAGAALGCERGGANAVALVAVTPIFVSVVLITIQFCYFAQSALYLHHAAYSAARAARVHACAPPPIDLSKLSLMEVLTAIKAMPCTNDPYYWETAARLALVAASPPVRHDRGSQSCTEVEPVFEATLLAAEREEDRGATRAKLCYAFAADTVSVEVTPNPADFLAALLGAEGRQPLTAEVRYRVYVYPFTGHLLGQGRRADGGWFRVATASVTLL